MQLRMWLLLFAMIVLTPELAIAQAPKMQSSDWPLIFREGVKSFYNGHYPDARQKFLRYKQAHPDDLLVALRLMYNRWFADGGERKGTKLAPAEYQALLSEVGQAIARYKKIGCSKTDLRRLTDNTINCPGVGSALYSFRLALVLTHYSNSKLDLLWGMKVVKVVGIWEDRHEFLSLAKQSHTPQANFLLGFAEYEVSKRSGVIGFVLHHHGAAAEHAEGVSKIVDSLRNDKSPFADDIRFVVFSAECGCDGSGKRYKRDDAFAKKYPLLKLAKLARRLYKKYPGNTTVTNFLRSTNALSVNASAR